jgi:hypothetical protein
MDIQEIIQKLKKEQKQKFGKLTVKNIPYIVRMGQLKDTYKND